MAEHPILFSADMVRAILERRKTITRRVMKPQPAASEFFEGGLYWKGLDVITAHQLANYSPYGKAGDRLWVKETFRARNCGTCCNCDPPYFYYRADGNNEPIKGYSRWRSGRFMPRTASRITLEIVSVRVERLQDISGSDALAEGISSLSCYGPGCAIDCNSKGCAGYRDSFRELWDSINGKKEGASWEANPFVWVVEFNQCPR